MFSKVVILSLIALAVAAPQHQQAAQYPAGVNPALCPGFPICDNALLHNPQPHHSQWAAPAPAPHWGAPAPAPHWGAPAPAPHWGAPSPYAYPGLTGPASNHLPGAGGDKYPAGVNPQTCPNYPFCDTSAGHHQPQVAPLPGWTERQYPAGVSPHTCPNFPYCT